MPLVSPMGQKKMENKHSNDPLSRDGKGKVAATGSANQGQAMQGVGPESDADDQDDLVGVSYHLLVPAPRASCGSGSSISPGDCCGCSSAV